MMKIIRVIKHTERELIKQLKKVALLNTPDILIYQNAFISLEKISTDFLSPPQNYLLINELEKVRNLKWELLQHDINIHELNGYVTIYFEDLDHPVNLLPPVVEESIENNGFVFNLINDGMHRLYMARLDMIVPQVVYIRGVPKKYPYYAYPLLNGWHGVNMVETVPVELLKKWHRVENYTDLYRNFNSAFHNVGGQRPVVMKRG